MLHFPFSSIWLEVYLSIWLLKIPDFPFISIMPFLCSGGPYHHYDEYIKQGNITTECWSVWLLVVAELYTQCISYQTLECSSS